MVKRVINEDSVFSVSNVIAFVALIVAIIGLPLFDGLFPSNDTKFTFFQEQASIGNGRLGKGPQIILGLNFSNLGNRAITISDAHIKYALGSNTSKITDCGSSEFTWMGVPWLSFVNENTIVQALPIQILAGMPHSEVIIFEPANVLSISEIEAGNEYRVFACLSMDYLNSSMKKYEKQVPLGYIRFTKDRVIDVNWSNEIRQVTALY